MKLLKILAMPIVELLLFKKAIKGVFKFLLLKLAALILKKVRKYPLLRSLVQNHQNDVENGIILNF